MARFGDLRSCDSKDIFKHAQRCQRFGKSWGD